MMGLVHKAESIESDFFSPGNIKKINNGSFSSEHIQWNLPSDGGPSEIGAQYNRPLYKGHRSRSQKFVSLYSSSTF